MGRRRSYGTSLWPLLSFCVATLCAVPPAATDEIHLKSGVTLTGTIVKQTDETVQLEFYGAPLTYRLQDIERIEKTSQPTAEPTDIVVRQLRDLDVFKRRAAAARLGQLQAHGAIEALSIAVLHDRDEEVRRYAAWALGLIGDKQAVTALLGALDDTAPRVREASASALGAIGDPGAVEPLLDRLQDDEASVRRSIVLALGAHKNRLAIWPLRTMLQDRHASVRQAAVTALGMILDVVEAGGSVARKTSGQPTQRSDAIDPVEPLLRAMQAPDPTIRRVAILALAERKDSRATPSIINALNDADAPVRALAVEALAQFRDPQASVALATVLRDPAISETTRRTALNGLMASNDPATLGPLRVALHDDQAQVRAYAAAALGRLGDQQAVTDLLEVLQDRAPHVRAQAAQALGQLKDVQALPSLIGALEDADPSVRHNVVGALAGLGDSRAVPSLIRALQDASWSVREQAAIALGLFKDSQAVQPLIDVLNAASQILQHAVTSGHRDDVQEADALSTQDAALGALRVMTQQTLGADHAAWQAWWDSQKQVQ